MPVDKVTVPNREPSWRELAAHVAEIDTADGTLTLSHVGGRVTLTLPPQCEGVIILSPLDVVSLRDLLNQLVTGKFTIPRAGV